MSAAHGRPRVVVDLTPMLPGADNGGAKIFVVELLRRLPDLAPGWDFVLLTPEVCHAELAVLDRENTRRSCILPRHAGGEPGGATWRRLARAVASRLPPPVAKRIVDLYWSVAHRQRRRTVVDELRADLLFNPFTAPLHRSPRVPSVSVVYDLQYASYPQFFTAEERYGRAAHMRAAARTEMLVCISDFVRDSVERQLGVAPDRLATVPIQLAPRLPPVDGAALATVLSRHALTERRYLLYPANFWPHKNHRMLLLALRQVVERNPASDLALVCTGQPGASMDAVVDDARRMGLAARCRFPGFVAEAELAALLEGCRAVIFPSLYEGFGMPLLEAMQQNRPVLCSDRGALPEVGGDAALAFDPRKPAAIAAAIERIDGDAGLRDELVRRGRRRRAAFADPDAMAAAYLAILAAVMGVELPVPAATPNLAPRANA